MPDGLENYYTQCSGPFEIFHPILPNQYKIKRLSRIGPVAQRLEQRTHNPLVPGSNPGGPTNFLTDLFNASYFSGRFSSMLRLALTKENTRPKITVINAARSSEWFQL